MDQGNNHSHDCTGCSDCTSLIGNIPARTIRTVHQLPVEPSLRPYNTVHPMGLRSRLCHQRRPVHDHELHQPDECIESYSNIHELISPTQHETPSRCKLDVHRQRTSRYHLHQRHRILGLHTPTSTGQLCQRC